MNWIRELIIKLSVSIGLVSLAALFLIAIAWVLHPIYEHMTKDTSDPLVLPLDYTFGDIKSLDNAYVNGDEVTGDIEVLRKGWKITIDKDGTVTREKEAGE